MAIHAGYWLLGPTEVDGKDVMASGIGGTVLIAVGDKMYRVNLMEMAKAIAERQKP